LLVSLSCSLVGASSLRVQSSRINWATVQYAQPICSHNIYWVPLERRLKCSLQFLNTKNRLKPILRHIRATISFLAETWRLSKRNNMSAYTLHLFSNNDDTFHENGHSCLIWVSSPKLLTSSAETASIMKTNFFGVSRYHPLIITSKPTFCDEV
jgi:hypothetical protein